MNDAERVIGRLEEFKQNSERRFDQLEVKIDALQEFRWRVAGGAAILGIIITGIVEFLHFSRG